VGKNAGNTPNERLPLAKEIGLEGEKGVQKIQDIKYQVGRSQDHSEKLKEG